MGAWYRSPDVAFESLGGDVHLLDLNDPSGTLSPRALEGPAAIIWLLLGNEADPVDEDDVISGVAAEYELEAPEVRTETVAFLENLEHLGLARRAKSTAV